MCCSNCVYVWVGGCGRWELGGFSSAHPPQHGSVIGGLAWTSQAHVTLPAFVPCALLSCVGSRRCRAVRVACSRSACRSGPLTTLPGGGRPGHSFSSSLCCPTRCVCCHLRCLAYMPFRAHTLARSTTTTRSLCEPVLTYFPVETHTHIYGIDCRLGLGRFWGARILSDRLHEDHPMDALAVAHKWGVPVSEVEELVKRAGGMTASR